MKKRKLGWAIVGLGLQAEKIAPAINFSQNGKLVAVFSQNTMRAKTFTKTHESKTHFDSYAELLKRSEVDAVFVASPNYQHKNHVTQALKAGKHVLCEKPLALSLKDGFAILKAAKKNKVKLGVGFHLRHHPIHKEAKKIISSGRLGKIKLIEMHWSVGKLGETKLPSYSGYMNWRNSLKKSGGGAIMARGVHLFDLLRFLTGLEPKEVIAFQDANKQKIDTTALGLFRFRDAVAMIATSRVIPQAVNDIYIYGSRGRLILRDALTTDSSGILEFLSGKKKVVKKFTKYNVYQKEIEDFGDMIFGKKNIPAADGRDGIKAIAMTNAFLKAAGRKRSVKIKSSVF